MSWFRKFMWGRSGSDQLSVFLMVMSIAFTWIGRLTGMSLLVILGYAALILGFYRIFSKNVQKRRLENYQFLMKTRPVREKFKDLFIRFKAMRRSQKPSAGKGGQTRKDAKTHHILTCHKCGKRLRVPRGKGKILVTCPVCQTKILKENV